MFPDESLRLFFWFSAGSFLITALHYGPLNRTGYNLTCFSTHSPQHDKSLRLKESANKMQSNGCSWSLHGLILRNIAVVLYFPWPDEVMVSHEAGLTSSVHFSHRHCGITRQVILGDAFAQCPSEHQDTDVLHYKYIP